MKAVLFDLDGTLLPMEMDEFTSGYFRILAKKAKPYGYEAEPLVKAIWHGTAAMVKNDGSCTNEEAFWRDFASIYGEKSLADKKLFDEFYSGEFQQAKQFCGFSPKADEAVRLLKQAGYRVALATNPLFPAVATLSRIGWAGLKAEDFELITTYENINWCKPNPDYYREVLRRMDLAPEDCLMVGNDVDEDMVAEKLGMKVFLLTDHMINKTGEDISRYPRGDFDALLAFLRACIEKDSHEEEAGS